MNEATEFRSYHGTKADILKKITNQDERIAMDVSCAVQDEIMKLIHFKAKQLAGHIDANLLVSASVSGSFSATISLIQTLKKTGANPAVIERTKAEFIKAIEQI